MSIVRRVSRNVEDGDGTLRVPVDPDVMEWNPPKLPNDEPPPIELPNDEPPPAGK